MIASRLDDRERVTPALTDHAEDKGGVIGAQTQYRSADSVNQLRRDIHRNPSRLVFAEQPSLDLNARKTAFCAI
jgi:hypothetical protein